MALPYLFIVCSAALFALLDLTSLRKNIFILYTFFLILLVFVGFRVGIGDTVTYYDIFRFPDKYATLIEDGYLWFQKFVRSILDDPHVFIFIFSFLLLAVKFIAFLKITPYPCIALLFYCGYFLIVQDMNQIRQGMAAGILLLSLSYVIQRRFIPFLILVVLAALIHASAYVFLIAYPLFEAKKFFKKFFVLPFLSFFTLFIDLNEILTTYAYQLLDILSFLRGTAAHTKITTYLIESQNNFAGPRFFVGSLFLVVYGVLFVVQNLKTKNPVFSGLLNIYFLGIILNFLGANLEFLNRISWYFIFVAAILYGYLVHFQKNIYNKTLLVLLLCFIVFFKVNSYVNSLDSGFISYENWLFQ